MLIAQLLLVVLCNWRQLPWLAALFGLVVRNYSAAFCVLCVWVLLRRAEFEQQKRGAQNTAAHVWLQWISGQSTPSSAQEEARQEGKPHVPKVVIGAWKTGAGESMENSADGVLFSVKHGAKIVHLDVAATQDRFVVAFDDSPGESNLNRLTGAPVGQQISRVNLADLPPIQSMIRGVDGSWVCTTDLAGADRRVERIEHVLTHLVQAWPSLPEEQQRFGLIINITQDSRTIVEHISELLARFPRLRPRTLVGSTHFPLVNQHWRMLNPNSPTLLTYVECYHAVVMDALGFLPFHDLPRNCVFLLPWSPRGDVAKSVSWFERMLLKCSSICRNQLVRQLQRRGVPVGFVAGIDELDDVVAAKPSFLLTTRPRGTHSYVTAPYMRGVPREEEEVEEAEEAGGDNEQ